MTLLHEKLQIKLDSEERIHFRQICRFQSCFLHVQCYVPETYE